MSDDLLIKTDKGFYLSNFVDGNGVACSIQESSAARTERMLWLGANDIGLKRFVPRQGWQDVALPGVDGVYFSANTRMHLTQSQVEALLPMLQRFAKTGTLLKKEKPEEGGDR